MHDLILKKLALYLSLFLGLTLILSSDLDAQQIDMVIFGDKVSETAHHLDQLNSTIGTGGLNESFRKLDKSDPDSSYFGVTLAVDPEVQNYITFKFWGSDTLKSTKYLHLHYYENVFGNIGRWTSFGSSGSDSPELINWSTSSIYPNRYIYVTYLLPNEILNGKDTIHMRLGGAELPIYKAYTHTNSYFKPDEEDAQGSAPAFNEPYSSPNGQSQIEHLHTQLDLAVDRFLTWQYYGEEWDNWVANDWAPEIMTGALNIHGAKDTSWTIDQYKSTWSARQNGHVRAQMPIETIALAFHKEWSKYYQDSTLIDRVVEALDFLRVAQGSDGGYIELENVPGGRWVGAPNRIQGVGSLMGFGMKGAPGAFLAMQNEIMTDSYMDEIINEGDSLITRRQAYINLFTGFREYLTLPRNRGHASNQDIVNLTAAYLADQCLHALDPNLCWTEETKQYYFDVCIGLEDGIYGGPWVSPKGTSLEGNGLARGGYETIYGEHNTEHYARLAVLSGEERLKEYLEIHLEALGKMRSLKYDNDLRPLVRNEEWLGWRKNYYPGSEGYGDVSMAAVLLDNEMALYGTQKAAAYGHYFKVDYSRYWVHLMSESSEMMRKVDYIEQALEMPTPDVKYPFEEGQPDFAWADEQAGLLVIKDQGSQLWATMQWRHPLENDIRHVDKALPNDKVRVHYSTPEYELLATTAMKSVDEMYSLYIWHFGKYLVLMNASPDTEYEFNLPDGSPSVAFDLISKSEIDLSSNPVIQPQTSLILEWPEGVTVSTKDELITRPTSFTLFPSYPNPFEINTTIEYEVTSPSMGEYASIQLVVYDIHGNKVSTLVDEKQTTGNYKVNFDASDMPSGIYYCQLKSGHSYQTRKLILQK
ncbi:T9SS type A sorting domain-containing protein [Portibacter lacus]|uniref:Secretion system C-terminal sorting domain-containing protein n=1 Tax=Portibacter lacus TaxID=1099794 RepID=A0AA37WGJ1_9BACT|nr:T9SS type A sorting domain-containing protein [Portibacter lacus]GLR19918.1 hypothetical protein GCM10007940_45340 [Portibacter lacus]